MNAGERSDSRSPLRNRLPAADGAAADGDEAAALGEGHGWLRNESHELRLQLLRLKYGNAGQSAPAGLTARTDGA